ncbi:MaoC family dehydratase [Microbacterium sp. NC79]|uniref:MaoC family dehydratase n=1 Tax=Microbacterium sp. NC79 TaxID=2851009 RepID=UPI001C2BE773|nr:MaoC family dehydratase [Microbacterium sp. NC79]MBV0896137.1 MaoC family dehydratase N-terminal domain-containing protein [Microbacterium sp. NC79]
MVINLDSVGLSGEVMRKEWTEKDTILYALAVGAGVADLDLTTENTAGVDLQAVSTFAAVIAGGAGALRERIGSWPGGMVVHGTQLVEFVTPLPASGEIDVVARVAAIEDKGSGALIEIESTATDPQSHAELFRSTTGLFVRGEGGFGGGGTAARGLASFRGLETAADFTADFATGPNQALLYRLCGDRNPLHSDPRFAAKAGFDRPILHGLCTWGIAARLLSALVDGDMSAISHFGGRFTAVVFPGDTVSVDAWRTAPDHFAFVVRVGDRVVIDSGSMGVRERD